MTDTAKGGITTGDQRPVMPALVYELTSMINRMPLSSKIWKRLRIAMTLEEVEAYKSFIKEDGGFVRESGARAFVYAIRGVPLQIEYQPTDPAYQVEDFETARDCSDVKQPEALT